MSYILGTIALLALLVASFKQPMAPLVVYVLLGQVESPRMLGLVSNTPFTRSRLIYLAILAFGIIYARLWRSYRSGELSKRHLFLVGCATALTAWTCLAHWRYSGDIPEAMSFIVSSGPLGVVLAVALRRKPYAKIALYLVVLVHIGLSFLITAMPGGQWTDLAYQDIYSQVSVDAVGVTSVGIPEVGVTSAGIKRERAQFDSSVILGFYGALAVLVGAYLGINLEGKARSLFGAVGVVFGVWALWLTTPRALLFATLLGVAILIVNARKPTVGRALVIGAATIALLYGAWWVFADTSSDIAFALHDHFASALDDGGYRRTMAAAGLELLFKYPLSGIGESIRLVELIGGAPHQSFYFVSLIFGLPAGICTLAITCLAVLALFSRPADRVSEGLGTERHLAKAVGVLTLTMALTNNMSAGFIGWLCLGYACLPWAEVSARRPPKATVGQYGIRRGGVRRLRPVSLWSPSAGPANGNR